MDEPMTGLELDTREYVCPACWLIHWGPAGPAYCDLA